MGGVVHGDEGSGPVRCEEWSCQMRGVVQADKMSGPGKLAGVVLLKEKVYV